INGSIPLLGKMQGERLSLSGHATKVDGKSGIAIVVINFHLSEIGFEFLHIVTKGKKQSFSVLRCHDDTALYFSFGNAGKYPDKIKDKFCLAMGNNGKIAIGTFCNFFG